MEADVHYAKPSVSISINRVGITGVKFPATALFSGARAPVLLELDALVELPGDLRGIHASRSYEVLFEVLSETASSDAPIKIEDVCARAAQELLRRHGYATSSEVRARGEVVLKRETPRTKLTTFEPCKLLGRAVARLRDDGAVLLERYVGVEVVGLLACPCAKALVERELKASSSGASSADLSSYVGTHTQRSVGRVMLEVPPSYSIDVSKLVKIVESSFSSPTYGLLKREDEVTVVVGALSRPKFAEDSVRAVAEGIVKAFPDLPNRTRVVISQRSLESVHKCDMVAVKKATLGSLRARLKWNSPSGGRAT